MGLLEFWNENDSIHFVYIFRSSYYDGILKETEETRPVWFDLEKIPYDNI